MKKLCFILFATFFGTSMAFAQKPAIVTEKKAGWHKISDAKVDFKTEKDQFLILGADKFKAIQLKANDAAIHIVDMQIHYEGGMEETVSFHSDIRAGGKSRVINLKYSNVELKKIVFVYHTVANAKANKAQIELWGLK